MNYDKLKEEIKNDNSLESFKTIMENLVMDEDFDNQQFIDILLRTKQLIENNKYNNVSEDE